MFVLMVVLVVSLGLYFRNSFESLEEKLSYQPVGDAQTVGKGTYGIEIVDGQTVDIPVYSHIYADGGSRRGFRRFIWAHETGEGYRAISKFRIFRYRRRTNSYSKGEPVS